LSEISMLDWRHKYERVSSL